MANNSKLVSGLWNVVPHKQNVIQAEVVVGVGGISSHRGGGCWALSQFGPRLSGSQTRGISLSSRVGTVHHGKEFHSGLILGFRSITRSVELLLENWRTHQVHETDPTNNNEMENQAATTCKQDWINDKHVDPKGFYAFIK